MFGRRTTLTGLLALPAVAALGEAQAVPFDIAETDWEGLSEFLSVARKELGEGRVKPVAVLDWSVLKPEDGLIFIHPEELIDASEASDFMRLGGRVAVIDDFGKGDDLLRRFKIERIRMPGQPVTALRGNPELAIAEPFLEVQRGQLGAPHPVVTNVKRLVLNHPMALIHPELSSVLKVRLSGTDEEAIVAVAGLVERGRLFAMSDPSALINSMLRYPGNRAFAAGLVRYLANDTAERPQGRLFVVVNRFSQEGSVGGDKTLFQEIEGAMQDLAGDMADARRDGLPPWFYSVLAGLGVTALSAWVAKASLKIYKSPLPRYARGTALAARGGVAGRFASLAAKGAPRSAALMELKYALFEALEHRFGLAPNAGREAILKAAADSQLLGPQSYARLEAVLKRMQGVETTLSTGGSARVSPESIAEAEKVVKEMLSTFGALERQRATPRVAYVEEPSIR